MTSEEEKAYFKGVLANVDSSITEFNFNSGFKIEAFSEEEALDLLFMLHKIPKMEIAHKYFVRYQSLNYSEHKMYMISKTIDTVPEDAFNAISKFDNKWVHGYLQPKIRLMRLFKEGNICMPVSFFHIQKNGKIGGTLRMESGRHISNEPYHIEISEIPFLQSFIQSVKLPFQRNFLNLAFENFELSYDISDMQLAFLVLMIGFETLLNPSHHEVRHRISRNAAVFLGENRKNSEDIFVQVKELYDKRSEIVHSGKRKIIGKEDLLKIRNYLRQTIKEMHYLDKEKSEIMTLLDSHGFGEKIKKS